MVCEGLGRSLNLQLCLYPEGACPLMHVLPQGVSLDLPKKTISLVMYVRFNESDVKVVFYLVIVVQMHDLSSGYNISIFEFSSRGLRVLSVPTKMAEGIEEGTVVKKVIGNLRSFLQNNLSIDEDFVLDLQAGRFLNETDVSRLRVSLSKGGSEALYSLLDHVASHYDQEMLDRLCSFLEDYSERKIRPRLRRIAEKIRNEMKR